MLNTKLKPKNVSDAYILLSVLADPEGCKTRLDELVAAEDRAVKEQEKAVEDKRHAAEEMAKMASHLEQLNLEAQKLSEAKSAFDMESVNFTVQVKSNQDRAKLLEADYAEKDKSLKVQLTDAETREDEAAALLDKAKKKMEQAESLETEAEKLRVVYEDKLAKLKSLT